MCLAVHGINRLVVDMPVGVLLLAFHILVLWHCWLSSRPEMWQLPPAVDS